MKTFPKKYKPQDLQNRSKTYRRREHAQLSKINTKFLPSFVPAFKKLSYQDFFLMYIKDFFNCKNNLESKLKNFQGNGIIDEIEHLFLITDNQFENLYSCYSFFNKRNQTLSQIGANKLERHILSMTKKNLKANNKILNAYFSSPYKFSILNSDVYIYIIKQIENLVEKGKISNEKNIGFWSFNLQTAIPLEHINRKEEKVPFYTLKYFVGAKCEALPVCIEGGIDLCCGDVALLVHPKDKRYNKYIGKNAIIPLCNRQIPIIGDENVNIALNNGIQRICPCADQESITLAEKYGLPTDIYVFNQQGLYTEYIHEQAFIGQKRNKYYENIEGFIKDIGNLSEKEEKISKVPYLKFTNERLIPYKLNQLIIDLEEEKEAILTDIFDKKIRFSFLDENLGSIFDEIEITQKELNDKIMQNQETNHETEDIEENEEIITLANHIVELKQTIIKEIEKYLPKNFVCNNKLAYGWKIPLTKNNDGKPHLFNIEKEYISWKDKPLQKCFNYTLISLIQLGTLGVNNFGTKNSESNKKLCEYDKIFTILTQNEKKIEYFFEELQKTTGEKPEYAKFTKIIQDLTDENNSTIDECKKLIDNCKFLQREGNRLLLDLNVNFNENLDPDFIQLCIPCYINNKGININDQIIHNKQERNNIFYQLVLERLFLNKNISHEFLEYSYDKENEFIGDKELSKAQLEQSQRNIFSLYGEDPIRLSLLINKTYDQKEILLNNIFLKQIWNATRFCSQKGFLSNNLKYTLNNQPDEFEDFDLCVISKLNELYSEREYINNFEEYIKFFNTFKQTIQNLFFSRYLEIQKTRPTNNVEFVCSYFFNFLLIVLYPLVPEFVDALCYVSEIDFLIPFKSVQLNKVSDYNMNTLYDTFIKIKKLKIEFNIKQHEYCNIFIKCSPSLGTLFEQHEQIFKNYFHISNISYLRLHEQNPLGYEVFNDDVLSIGIQAETGQTITKKDSIESIEKDLKNMEEKLQLIRERMQMLPEGEQRKKAEEEYVNIKKEMEKLTIKYSLLNSK